MRAYTRRNYKTKKTLIEAVKAGRDVYVYDPALIPEDVTNQKTLAVCGPCFEMHRWYATVQTDSHGRVTKDK